MPDMKEIVLSDLQGSERQQLRQRLMDGRPVILLGSYISIHSCTNLPSGEQISDHIFNRLFYEATSVGGRSWPKWLRKDYQGLPFEGVWACHPSPDAVVDAIVRLYSRDEARANGFHDKIAEALQNGAISAVVTTNYDLALERSKNAAAIRVIERHLTDATEAPAVGVYFKIHGSAKPELKDTIVFRLEQEGRLDPWKRKLLASLLKNRTLLVIGYSGRDFDICPEIATMKSLTTVYWLQKPSSTLSPNAIEVLRARGGTPIVGDFGDFMSLLFEDDFAIGKGGETSIKSLGEDLFRPQHCSQWRIRILERLRCYTLCRPLLDLEPEPVRKSLQDVYINLLGHHGKYGQAAKANLRCSNQHARGSLGWISYRIAASGSHLGQGKHIRAIWQYLCARLALKRQLRLDRRQQEKLSVAVQLLRQALTLAMRARQFRLFKRTASRPGVLHRRLHKLYRQTLRFAAFVGTLDDSQWVQINAERLGFKREIGQPLPSLQGLANLGLRGSAIIPVRDEIRDGDWDITDKRLRTTRRGLMTAVRYGLLHEMWKFSWLLAWRGPKSCRAKHLADWLRGFFGTEYGLPYRIFILYRALGPRKGKQAYCLTRALYGILLWSKARQTAALRAKSDE